MTVYGGISMYVKVYGGIWKYMWGAPGTDASAAGELIPSELYHQGGMRISLIPTDPFTAIQYWEYAIIQYNSRFSKLGFFRRGAAPWTPARAG